ncbi:MAG: MFS transporter [Simkaniaceae bacterium]|nr:MFS transporter [Simkaniaceae bacterium]
MIDLTSSKENDCKRTKRAVFFLHILSEPIVAFYSLLPFILIHDLSATPIQLAIFISLRPIFSVIAPYWSAFYSRNTNGLLINVKLACVFAYLPFLLFSHTKNVWLIMASAALFQLFHKAGVPAWLEIVKHRISQKSRENAFSLSFVMGFICSAVFGMSFGYLLDKDAHYLSFLIMISALIGLSCLVFLHRIPEVVGMDLNSVCKDRKKPLKMSITLLKDRPDVRRFQIVFMIGGGALMLMAPSLSIYYVEVLELNYIDITLARFVFMALGVMVSMYPWKRLFQRLHINELLGPVLIGFTIFPCLLLFAKVHLLFLYVAFFMYGIAQAGSRLVWSLSPLSFSKNHSSIHFSQANLFLAGVRGAVFPFLGSVLCKSYGASLTLTVGAFVCLLGVFYAYQDVKHIIVSK